MVNTGDYQNSMFLQRILDFCICFYLLCILHLFSFSLLYIFSQKVYNEKYGTRVNAVF